MTREHRDFARIYYREFRRDYPDIYADTLAFGAWTKMLIASEEAWPAMPELPRSIGAGPLRKLVDRGLVTFAGSTFTLKGWVVERTKRQQSASNAAALRWHSDRTASDADADAMLVRERVREREGKRDTSPVEKGDRLRLVDPA